LETPEEVVRVLGPYAVNLHVKDFTIRRMDHQMGFVVEGCPVGEGRLDLPRLIAAIRANGHGANAILELWTPPAATLDATLERENTWAIASVATLRKLLKD
jgi:sugar phosphate isomerase/epimerase